MAASTKNNKLIRITTVPIALAYPLNCQPSFMNSHGFDVMMISSSGKEVDQVRRQENCPLLIVEMTRSITPFRDLASLIKLIGVFRREKPLIVHTETPKAGLLGMLAAKFSGVKIRIHTVAGLPLMVEKGFKLRLLTFIEKLTYSAATNVWPNSNSLNQYILNHKLAPPSKLKVIGGGSSNGINTIKFNRDMLDPEIIKETATSFQFDASLRYLLFVGRIVVDKGVVELVKVFRELQRTDPSLRLIIVGDFEPTLDPVPADIEEEIKTNSGIIRVTWTDKVEYYMALAHYFVFPSYREGFPNVLLEAAAMRLPIICSRIAGNVDIVTNNETGVIFESQDEQALRQAIIHGLADAGHSKQMADKLHQVITTTYKREIFWNSMLNSYRELAQQ